MIGNHRLQGEFQPGLRVVSGRGHTYGVGGSRSWEELRVEEVVEVDHDALRRGSNARMTLRHGDEVRSVMLCHTSIADTAIERNPWKTLWTDELPTDDAVAIELVAGALRSSDSRKVILLWIGSVMDDGVAYAHLLLDRVDMDDRQNLAIPTSGMAYAPHAIKIMAKDGLENRTLIVATLGRAHEEEGVTVHSISGVRTLMRDVGLKTAAEAVPSASSTKGHYTITNFAGWYEITENEDMAHACTQPSESLVLCWEDGDRQYVKCMGQTGIDFWRNDDPECYAEQSIPGVGLWMWTDVKYHGYRDHEGGYDADMDGDWSPATPSDVERMFGPVEEIAADIREYTGEDESDATAERYIRLAHETELSERQRDEERAAALETQKSRAVAASS